MIKKAAKMHKNNGANFVFIAESLLNFLYRVINKKKRPA